MNTYFGLLAQFGTAEIPLELCCSMFGLSSDEAAKRAARGTLPVPAYRATKSQKAPWLVAADVLAAHLDDRKRQAVDDWNRLKGAA